MQKPYRHNKMSRRATMRLLGAATGVAAGAIVTNSLAGAAAAAALRYTDATGPANGPAAGPHALSKLTAAHFEPLVGEQFTVGKDRVILRRVRRGHSSGLRFREQFALVFRVPPDLPIGSEMLPVSHPSIGRHNLLVSQTADAVDGKVLEICFS